VIPFKNHNVTQPAATNIFFVFNEAIAPAILPFFEDLSGRQMLLASDRTWSKQFRGSRMWWVS